MNLITRLLANIRLTVTRTLVFTGEQRSFFFILLREYVKSNFPMIDIMRQIEQSDTSQTIKHIARLGRRNITRQRPFCQGFERSGLFTPQEEALLRLGERNNAMENTVSLILSTDTHRHLIIQIIAPSLQWLLTAGIILYMAADLGPTLSRFAAGYTWYFEVCALTLDLLPPLILTATLGIPAYIYLRNRHGPINKLITATRINRLHARTTERAVLYVLAELIRSRIPPREITDTLITLFPSQQWLHERVHTARRRLAQESIAEVLDVILSGQTYLHVLAAAPNRAPEELAAGMNMAINILDIHINRQVKFLSLLAMISGALIAGFYLIPFMLISLGAGTAESLGVQ